MWISKDEYNLLVQNSEIGARVGMLLAETLTNLNETQLELIQVKRELEGVKAAYESEHAEANEWFYQYTIAEENHKRAKERSEELAKEASGLARELTHAEVDLALYKKAFDDIAHSFGDEFRYLNGKSLLSESMGDRDGFSRAIWATSNLWFVVHDIMKNAGWRVEDADT